MQTQTSFETHGPAIASAAVCLAILNPVLAFVIYALAAWLMNV